MTKETILLYYFVQSIKYFIVFFFCGLTHLGICIFDANRLDIVLIETPARDDCVLKAFPLIFLDVLGGLTLHTINITQRIQLAFNPSTSQFLHMRAQISSTHAKNKRYINISNRDKRNIIDFPTVFVPFLTQLISSTNENKKKKL